MGDSSFPAGYWESFRAEVKGNDPKALIISETWQKDSTLLRMRARLIPLRTLTKIVNPVLNWFPSRFG